MILDGGIKKFLLQTADYFLPRFCTSCSTKLSVDENILCNNCLSKIQRASEQRLKNEYDRKFKKAGIISEFYSLFVFEKDKELQHSIHSLKYNNNFRAGIFLGKLLGEYLKNCQMHNKIDLIIPVPLHSLKKAERGFNQSFYIAKGVNQIFHRKVSDRFIKRIRYTESQTTMNIIQRRENISGAFRLKKMKSVNGKNILLIDDVITTGATITECGLILKEANANKIYAASIAIAD